MAAIFAWMPGSAEDWLVLLLPLTALALSWTAIVLWTKYASHGAALAPRDVAAVFLTPLLWPVGVLLLWSSRAWSRREKLIRTFALPGGYALAWSTLGVRASAAIPPPGSQPGWVSPSAPLHAWAPPEVVHAVVALAVLAAVVVPSITMMYLVLRLRISRGPGVRPMN